MLSRSGSLDDGLVRDRYDINESLDKVGGAFLGGNHRLFRTALMIQEAAGNVRKRYILPQL